MTIDLDRLEAMVRSFDPETPLRIDVLALIAEHRAALERIRELEAGKRSLMEVLREVRDQLDHRWGFADAPHDPDALHMIALLDAAMQAEKERK